MSRNHHQFPSLRQRLLAAQQNSLHSATMHAASHGASTPIFLIDPSIANSVLSHHELTVIENDPDSDSDSSSPVHTHIAYNANLQKPTKPTKLLRHALTNANGDTWIRQRYCVSRAFVADKALRASCATCAVEKTMEYIFQANESTSNWLWSYFSRRKNSLDVRLLAREVAIDTMSRMVLGTRRGSSDAVNDALREMVSDSLETRRNEEFSKKTMRKVERLDEEIRKIIDDISKNLENNDLGEDSDSLARHLLSYEKKERTAAAASSKYLTRDEVVGNSHSALLAGVQTICTTIAGALLHLAENPQMQHEIKVGNISGKDVVKETLRILPPVAGMPRIPRECDLALEDHASSSTYTHRKCPARVSKDQLMIVDLLAFAHSQPLEQEDKTEGEGSTKNPLATLIFDPTRKQKSNAHPWGIGKRKCPAGIISVGCIGAVIEALAKDGMTWSFADPKLTFMGVYNAKGWMESISYRPTLSYASPIFLNFSVKQEVG